MNPNHYKKTNKPSSFRQNRSANYFDSSLLDTYIKLREAIGTAATAQDGARAANRMTAFLLAQLGLEPAYEEITAFDGQDRPIKGTIWLSDLKEAILWDKTSGFAQWALTSNAAVRVDDLAKRLKEAATRLLEARQRRSQTKWHAESRRPEEASGRSTRYKEEGMRQEPRRRYAPRPLVSVAEAFAHASQL